MPKSFSNDDGKQKTVWYLCIYLVVITTKSKRIGRYFFPPRYYGVMVLKRKDGDKLKSRFQLICFV
jgi:hypothetical protein